MAGKNVTSDIKETWLNPIRAAQAACKANKGLAIITLVILVDKNDPVRWKEPKLEKVHPIRATAENCNEEVLASILEAAQVDNT